MGSYLSSVASGNELKSSCVLIELSLSKIRELHGAFKSVCDNFAINLTEFESIFASNQATFAMFDTDNNGLIDALEIFSGLIMFSDSKAEDKIRFLFDLFDFNEIQSISLMDLEFMLWSVLQATSKIYGLGEDVRTHELQAMIKGAFQEGQRVSLHQLLVWAVQTPEISQYFAKFRLEGPEMISQKTLQDNDFIILEKHDGLDYRFQEGGPIGVVEMKQTFIAKSAAQLVGNPRSANFRAWLHTALQPIIAFRLESVTMNNYLKTPDEIKIKLEWMYGIRCQDTKRCMQYAVGRQFADSIGTRNKYEKKLQDYNEEIIYFCSSTVILLNQQTSKQRFYTEHVQEIISLALSNLNGDIAATGELSMLKPAVHIWNTRTLENINVLQGIHHKGIHLLAFSNDDRFLITCGLQNPSAVLIYDWASGNVVVSASIPSPTQDIVILRGRNPWSPGYLAPGMLGEDPVPRDEEKKPIEGFVLISLESLIVFAYDASTDEFRQNFVQLEEAKSETTALPLCAMSLLADFKNCYFKDGNAPGVLGGATVEADDAAALDADHTLKHFILTGHEDGRVLIWSLQKFVCVLDDYKVKVTCMSKCFEGIAFATADGKIHIWDEYLYKAQKIIDINQMPFKILSSMIVALDFNQKRLLVTTINGDVIEIILTDAGSSKTIKAHRVNTVVRITGRHNKALTILSQTEQTIMMGGDNGVVSSFDIQTHELIDIWSVGQPITSIACLTLDEGGFVVAAGTEEGKIIIRQDWEEFIPRQHICGQKAIIDVKFSKNGQLIAAASLDKSIYLMKYADGDYVALAACKLDNGFPVSLNFSEDSSKIVINTNQRKLLIFDPVSFLLQYKPEDISQCFWSSWISKFPLITKSINTTMMPITLGNLSNVVVAGDENGNINIWKDVESIKENVGSNFQCHTTNVQKLELTIDDKRIVSLGYLDQSMCQFKLKPIFYQETQVNLKRGLNELSQGYGIQKIVLNPQQDETLILELNYCFQIEKRKTDQVHDQTVLVRGSNNKTVNTIHAQLNFDNEEKVWQRPPSISLILENIYGVLVSDKRHTLMYMHFYDKAEQERIDFNLRQQRILDFKHVNASGITEQKALDDILPRVLGTGYADQLKQQQPIDYDPVHVACQKNIAYYSSRIGVVLNTNRRMQTFYQSHKLKISCIAKHPRDRIIATGEVNVQPLVHVWDADTMETLVVLRTAHKGGVLHLTFSTDGRKLISIGMDRTFSMQIFLWRQQRSIAFRNTGYYPIFGIRFNPYDDSCFYTCGYQHLAEWRIKGSHLTCAKFVNVYNTSVPPADGEGINNVPVSDSEQKQYFMNQKNILTCIDFISFRQGHSIQSDVVFGNNLGDISTYCNSKYFVLSEQAHPGVPINCIRVTNALSLDRQSCMVVTGGEDGLVKIWNASIQLKQMIDLRQSVDIQDLKNIKSYGIQSLDVYACDRQSAQSTGTVKVLCGMRSGDVVECIVDFNRDFTSQEEIYASKLLTEEQKIVEIQKLQFKKDYQSKYIVKFQSITSGHSSLQISHKQKKIISCLYPLYGILASVGNDETLMFWDINNKSSLISKNLGTQATCLDFSPDGRYLAIGLVNGVFLVLECKIEQRAFGANEQYSPPSLAVIMCPKESRSSVVNIKFSHKGDYLIVSYNNEYKVHDMVEENQFSQENHPLSEMQILNQAVGGAAKDEKRDPSFALLYVNKISDKNTSVKISTKDPYVKMQKIQIPLQEYQSSAAIRQKLAITKLDFSSCDRYIEMCSQMIDKDNNIQLEYALEDIYVVWDISKGLLVNDYSSLSTTSWPDWSLSSSLNVRYVNQGFNKDTDDEEKRKFGLEQAQQTAVCRFNLLNNAVSGSLFGELFAFRFGSLNLDRNRLADFQCSKVAKRNMAISKGFDALTSMVQSINIFDDKKVFVTGNNDQCILQYKVEYEDQDWELDFNNFDPDVPDPFGEIPIFPKFTSLTTEIWTQRQELPEIQQNIDTEEYNDPTASLDLQYVIGRRALDRRNNLKIDCQDRILYSASSLMVFLQDNLDPDDKTLIQQTFLRPQKEKFTSTSPEVSCFDLSVDRRLLFIGTNSIEANLLVWEISTNLLLCQMVLPQLSIIYTLRLAYDNKHVLLIGVNPEYILTVILLEYTSQNIICEKYFLHSLPFKIKDAQFIPGYTRRFVTCGIQHMCYWKFNGQSLEFTVAEIAVPKAFSKIGQGVFSHDKNNAGKFGLNLVCRETEMINAVLKNQQTRQGMMELDEELENIYVTFLCAIYVQNTLITSGDDGQLYIWEHQRIVRRVAAHEGSIYALDVNEKLGFMASGGMEGIVILWRLVVEPRSNVKSLDKLKVFRLRANLDAQQAVMTPEYNVQSICLGYNRVVIGMRSGTILETMISETDAQGNIVGKKHNFDANTKIRKWMKCTDDQIPIAVAIDMVSEKIFSMTEAGKFTAWDLVNFDVMYQKDFHKTAQNIIAFKHSNKILLVFDNDILVLGSNISEGYDELKEYELKLNKISDAKLNNNEKILGVASTSSSTPEVSLYETEDGFAKLTTFYGFKTAIRYIDFSTDNYYLQVEDQIGEVQLFEIESARLIANDAVDFELQWLGEGLRSYSPLENVRKQYNADNKILQICKLQDKPIVAIGDEIGTIRFFNYPNKGSDGYFQCYGDHLYRVSQCLFSHDQLYFLSISPDDKCIFKWKVHYNEQKIKELALYKQNQI